MASLLCKSAFGTSSESNSWPIIWAYNFFIASGITIFDLSTFGRFSKPNNDRRFFSIWTSVWGSGLLPLLLSLSILSLKSTLLLSNDEDSNEDDVYDSDDEEDFTSSVLATCWTRLNVASTARTKSHARMIVCNSEMR